MTTDEQKKAIFDQPSAFKLVFAPENGVNGHCIIRGPDCWHMYYGPSDIHGHAKYHATSDDLLTWKIQPPILESGGPGNWDHDEVGDCCVTEFDGKWYIHFQGKRTRKSSRKIGMAVSDDLWNWQRIPDANTPVFTPNPEWSGYTETSGPQYCKDPWIIRHDGQFLMCYICLNKAGDSCVAVATSTDLVKWEDKGPVATVPWIPDDLVGPAGFETPRMFERNGKFYLYAMYFWGTQIAVSDDPFHFDSWTVMGPWHAPTIFNDGDRWFISHSHRNIGKPSIRGSKGKPFRGVYIAGLVWAKDFPFTTDLRDVMEGWPS